MAKLFGLLPRLALGSLTAYFISQFLDLRLLLLAAQGGPRAQSVVDSHQR